MFGLADGHWTTSPAKGVLTVWHVSLQDSAQRYVQKVIPIGLDDQGKRSKAIELLVTSLGNLTPASASMLTSTTRTELVNTVIPDMKGLSLTAYLAALAAFPVNAAVVIAGRKTA